MNRIPPFVEFLARLRQAREMSEVRPAPPESAPAEAPPAPIGAVKFASKLEEVGIESGDCLMLHSDADAIARVFGEPAEFIDFMVDYLGPNGTLSMPSHPKLKNRDGILTYTVQTSPSTVGLMTESFRRRPNTVRSRFPISSLAHAASLPRT